MMETDRAIRTQPTLLERAAVYTMVGVSCVLFGFALLAHSIHHGTTALLHRHGRTA